MQHPAAETNPVERLTLSFADLCRLLNRSEATLRKSMPELEAAGFPGKIPGINSWSRAAVEDWVAHCGGTYVPFAERAAAAEGPLGEAARDLELVYAPQALKVAS